MQNVKEGREKCHKSPGINSGYEKSSWKHQFYYIALAMLPDLEAA